MSKDKEIKVDAERLARWEAYLAKARADLKEPEQLARFDAQRTNKEFDKIPDEFV